ncbi:hypothetical protein [uncultured Algibacter sp.]|uniref:hypothetical protein n=1 Tax=uncultured Algibacter sp. TaxID=298659 RepID=UPI002603951E|nr:hypothetical protein [uncultured Algibacter sp.]
MKNRIKISVVLLLFTSSIIAQCTDINTKEIAKYLNEKVKPRLDIKLDKHDGFLAINGTRQNLDLKDVKISPVSREWTYFFENVRRIDSNFWYDSKKNAFVLDVKFENNGIELKGRCEGCLTKRMKDDRAPDINWANPQIMRFTLKPIVFQRSVSFKVTQVEMLGKLVGSGFGSVFSRLTKGIEDVVGQELTRVFTTDVTKRLFNDALRPLLKSKKTVSANSVSLASSSLRVCK